MTERAFEVTYCPAPDCTCKVRVWPEGINYCCLNCWRWTWESGVMRSVPLGPDGEEIEAHSDQCRKRQVVRDDWEVTEGTFEIMAPKPEDVPGLLASRPVP